MCAGDLAVVGALLSGNNVAITKAGDVSNSSTVLERKLVQLDAQNTSNLLGIGLSDRRSTDSTAQSSAVATQLIAK